jgi:ADP-heptose:LPS heptosyltransferase
VDAPSRILIIRPGALGDTVVTAPVIAALRAKWPAAYIQIAGRLDYVPLLVHQHSLADACCSTDDAAFTSLYTDGPLTIPPADLVVAYLPDQDGALARRLDTHVAQAIVFDPRPPDGGSTHICDHLLSALRPLGIEAVGEIPQLSCLDSWRAAATTRKTGTDTPLSVPAFRGQRGHDRSGKYIAIHPGSGGRAKTWPVSRWAEVIDALGDVPIVITAGPADDELIQELRQHLGDREKCSIIGDLSVTELAGVLAGANNYAGVDSGVSHLATALGVRTVAIFGPTDPAVWAPRGPGVCVLRNADTTAAVSVAEAVQVLRRSAQAQIPPDSPFRPNPAPITP